MRYPRGCCALRPATKFASAGLSRYFVLGCVLAIVISEFASLVRKSYSKAFLESVLSYWTQILPFRSNLIPLESHPGRNPMYEASG